jgi:hypothetical protein
MAAISDFELLLRASAILLRQVDEANDEYVKKLQSSASTVFVNGLRTCTMARTLIAVGTVGAFEALLQRQTGWKNAFVELDATLNKRGQADLVERFRDFRDAINVLKHGEGRSYERLLSRREHLPFTVKERDMAFFEEGDVSEVARLIDADGAFIESCIDVIREIMAVIDLQRP